MTPSEKYTAAAYLVVFVGVLAYVLIIASKLQRLQRQVGELVEQLRERDSRDRPRSRVAELLFWPALLGYGEAAIAYTSPRYTRLAIVGRADRLARADRASRRPGGARRRLPVVDAGPARSTSSSGSSSAPT